jgi:hypothetical protein
VRQSQVARVVEMVVQCAASETQGIIAHPKRPVTQSHSCRPSSVHSACSAQNPAKSTHAQKSQPGGTITSPGAALTVASIMVASPSAATMLPRCGAMLRRAQELCPSSGVQQRKAERIAEFPGVRALRHYESLETSQRLRVGLIMHKQRTQCGGQTG